MAPNNTAAVQTSATLRRGAPVELITSEWSKPANCFTITDKIEENIRLEIGHPMTGGKIALVLGEDCFIARDKIRGCLYTMEDHRALVRRAKVEYFTTHGGKKIASLRRLETENPEFKVLHVHFGLREGIRLNPGVEKLYSGVFGGNLISRSDSEALVELKKTDGLTIFYPDGPVSVIEMACVTMSGVLESKVRILHPGDALTERLKLVDKMFERAYRIADENKKAKKVDRAFHELASMIRLTKASAEHRACILNAIEAHAGNRLRSGVQKHLRLVLEFVGDRNFHPWLDATDDPSQMRSLARMFPGRNEYGGGHARSGKQMDRSERDRQLRASMRGVGGASSQQSGHGKGSGKGGQKDKGKKK